MAKKVYTRYNYFFVEDTVTNEVISRLRQDVHLRKTPKTTSTLYEFWDTINGEFARIAFSDIVDSTSTPYASQAVFEAWFWQNTGLSDSATSFASLTALLTSIDTSLDAIDLNISTAHHPDAGEETFDFIATGGKSVTSESYIPNYDPDLAVKAAFDKVNGRLLVQDDKIEEVEGNFTITSPDTAWVAGTDIDLRAFQRVSFYPEVTTSAGTYAEYKVQWSMDQINWFDETIDEPGTAASGEILVSQNTMVRQFTSTLGVKTTSSITLDKKARYVRLAQRSNAAGTTIATKYRYQKIRN